MPDDRQVCVQEKACMSQRATPGQRPIGEDWLFQGSSFFKKKVAIRRLPPNLTARLKPAQFISRLPMIAAQGEQLHCSGQLPLIQIDNPGRLEGRKPKPAPDRALAAATPRCIPVLSVLGVQPTSACGLDAWATIFQSSHDRLDVLRAWYVTASKRLGIYYSV